jgi:hypothetical protein
VYILCFVTSGLSKPCSLAVASNLEKRIKEKNEIVIVTAN